MFIKQFRFSMDNLGYLIHSTGEGIVIDGGSVDNILAYARENDIHIKYISNTHFHDDHTLGNAALLEQTNAGFIDCRQVKSDQNISLDQEVLKVYHTPGHTIDSVTFQADDFLVTGDTLFNGTVGNCFSGDLNAFFNSLKRLISLSPDTKIYSGHDYVLESLAIAQKIEKDNPLIEKYIQKYNPDLVTSTLADELEVNPYIRFNAEAMVNKLTQRNMPADTEIDRFKSIMEIY